MPSSTTKTPYPVAFWIIICAFLNCAGWALSAVHQLNPIGYVAVMAAGLGAAVFWWKRQERRPIRLSVSRWKRRFRRPFPLGFLILAILVVMGGVIHAPSNYDALAYRVPRVLNWLAEGQWHWIHTDFQRLNVRAVGIEWISAPLIALTRSDRFLFLINAISFLLLPGLVYGVFTRLGVQKRTAWYWMWLVPAGYCFVLQGGSIGNDLYGAVFALAAMDFALRARDSRKVGHVWLSCLAVALLTGGKTSNLPLLLPWGLAILPSLPLVFKRPLATVAVAIVAAVASFLPMALANIKHCGDWSGQAAEQAQFGKGSPMLHISQNGALLVIQNFVPPVFPVANAWNKFILKVVPEERKKKLEVSFEPMGRNMALSEMQIEEDAGIGFGLSTMLLLTVAATVVSKISRQEAHSRHRNWYTYAILISAWVSLLPYMIVSGSSTAARLVTPHYALLIPLFLLWQSGNWIAKNRWWKFLALGSFALAMMLAIITPARPLWPACTVLAKINHGGNPLLKRAESVYTVYNGRSDGFAPMRAQLPTEAGVIGLVSFDDPETSLWKPFGQRRIFHILASEDNEDLARRGIQYVLLNPDFLMAHGGMSIDNWIAKHHAELVRTVPLTLRASKGPVDWSLVKLPVAGTKSL